MIAIIGGVVVAIGLLVFMGKPNEKEIEERLKKEAEPELPEPAPPCLSEEEQAEQLRLKKQNYQEALRRREHLLGNLSTEDRKAFEELAAEMRGEMDENGKIKEKPSDANSFYIEILLIFSGLLLVYALLALTSDQFYSPLQIIRIISTFFATGSSGNSEDPAASTSSQSSSPFGKSSDL